MWVDNLDEIFEVELRTFRQERLKEIKSFDWMQTKTHKILGYTKGRWYIDKEEAFLLLPVNLTPSQLLLFTHDARRVNNEKMTPIKKGGW